MYVLTALIPYSKSNLQLSFKPNAFFNELEKISKYKRNTLQTAMWRARQRGYIEREGSLVRITEKGLKKVKPYEAKKLNKEASLIIIFDIPEELAPLRRRLRLLLREWKFIQVQKSVWASKYDYKKLLINAVEEMEIENFIQIFEGAKLYPKN